MKRKTAKPRKAGKKPILKKALSNCDRLPKLSSYECRDYEILDLSNIHPLPLPEKTEYEIKIKRDDIFTFSDGGCRSTLTGRELMTAFKQGDIIKSLEKEIEVLTKIATKQTPIPDIPQPDAARAEERLEIIENLFREARLITKHKKDYLNDKVADSYEYSFYNGLETILSLFEQREAHYMYPPIQKLREKSPAEEIQKFLKAIYPFKENTPMILKDVNMMLLNRVRDEAEKTSESAIIAKKLFEECMQVLSTFR